MIELSAKISVEDLTDQVVSSATVDQLFNHIKGIELTVADTTFLRRLLVHFANEMEAEVGFEVLSEEFQEYIEKEDE